MAICIFQDIHLQDETQDERVVKNALLQILYFENFISLLFKSMNSRITTNGRVISAAGTVQDYTHRCSRSLKKERLGHGSRWGWGLSWMSGRVYRENNGLPFSIKRSMASDETDQ